jgi:transcription elongation factor Elf1
MSTHTSDDTVVPQGQGRNVDCPMCGAHKLYVFAVGGLTFVHCVSCNARLQPIGQDLTIAQLKSLLVKEYRP